MGQSGPEPKSLTGKEKEFVAEIAEFITCGVREGVGAFVVFSITDDQENDNYNIKTATIIFDKSDRNKQMVDDMYELVEKFMDDNGNRVRKN